MDRFVLHSKYKPTGDQPEAIEKLTEGINAGYKEQTLLGVTGSGKTFTMANIIANINLSAPCHRASHTFFRAINLSYMVCPR